jgi:3-oxoacyl-[acyl-carrier-protein] synthase-1
VQPVACTEIGMACSLGLHSAGACAAARAGLVRMSGINTLNYALDPDLSPEGLDGPDLLAAHMLPVTGSGTTGIAKLLALARPALSELLSGLRLTPQQWARTSLAINVSDGYFQSRFGVPPESDADDEPDYATQWVQTARELPHRLCAEFTLPIEKHRRFILPGGHAGFADLLLHASHLLNTGEVDRCIVGAVESCLDPQAIVAYARAGALKCGTNPAGFTPGEAAAFLLLEQPGQAQGGRVGLVIDAISKATGSAYFQSNSVPDGRGLASCLSESLTASQASSSPEVIVTDLNGSECRAADWGAAIVQVCAEQGDFSFASWLPARSFGETGAASGGLAVCQLFRAVERGYAPPNGALVALCSEDGSRSVLRVRSLNRGAA